MSAPSRPASESAPKLNALGHFRVRAKPEMPRQRRPKSFKQWKFKGSPILDEGANFEEQLKDESRMTKAGITEGELLHSLNYLDKDGLLAFPGIGEVTAGQIQKNIRETNYYHELEELLGVPRFGVKRFENLVGRPPRSSRLNLRQLMHISHAMTEPITLENFRPWKRPASGIAEAWLISSKEFSEKRKYFESFPKLIVERVASYRLILACEQDELKGRASYLTKKLPKLIRSINYERSFTTAT